MNMTAIAALLCIALPAQAAPALRKSIPPGSTLCHEEELPPGTALPDGTVAGEKQALTYIKESAPKLWQGLARIEAGERRRSLGRYFVWFQRVGPCRQNQKAKMLEQLEDELLVRSLKGKLGQTDTRARLREVVARIAEREVWLAEFHLKSVRHTIAVAEEDLAGLRQEAAALEDALARRRANLDKEIDERLP